MMNVLGMDLRYAPRTMRRAPVLTRVAVLLLLTAWLASWLPARRTAGVDPASALRRG